LSLEALKLIGVAIREAGQDEYLDILNQAFDKLTEKLNYLRHSVELRENENRSSLNATLNNLLNAVTLLRESYTGFGIHLLDDFKQNNIENIKKAISVANELDNQKRDFTYGYTRALLT